MIESEALVRMEPGSLTADEAREWAGRIFGVYNIVTPTADKLIEIIPLLSDDDVLQARGYARDLFRASWRIEIAADGEISTRVRLRGGRGKKDEAGEGRMLGYEQAAQAAGVDSSTIRRNAQMYQVFFGDAPETVLRAQQSLGEKRYLEEALRAEDPHAAIIYFAERKQADPSFTTRDARRWVQVGDVGEIRQRIIPSLVALTLEEPQRTIWEMWLSATNALRKAIPELRRDLNDCVKICREQLSRPAQTTEERICALLIDHPGSYAEDLSRWLDLDSPKTDAVLEAMRDDAIIREVPDFDKSTKFFAARGAVRMTYYYNYPVGADPNEYKYQDPTLVDEFGDEM